MTHHLFTHIRPLPGSEVIQEHIFPLFEYTGLYQQISVPEAGVQAECIIVSLQETAGKSVEYLLNLISASGYLSQEAELNFRESPQEGYLYTYFNIRPL